jgi:uncharacterized protein (TIGR00251 family)
MSWFYSEGDGVYILSLYIQPGARRTEAVGLHGDAMKIKVAAVPIESKANAALLNYLADCFEVPLNQVLLKQGRKSRRKVVAILQTRHHPDTLFQG